MKKFFRNSMKAVGAALVFSLFALLFTVMTQQSKLIAQVGTIVNELRTPVAFRDYTKTNSIVIDNTLNAPIKLYYGTNLYTAMTSTNRKFLGGTGVTNTFVIKNGLIVDIQ